MSDYLSPASNLPPEQEAIRAKCFHPSGTFIEFKKEEIEQSIPKRFEKIVIQYPNRIAVKSPVQEFIQMAAVIIQYQGKQLGQEVLDRIVTELEAMSEEQAKQLLTDQS